MHESPSTVRGQLYLPGRLGLLVRDPAGRLAGLGSIVRPERRRNSVSSAGWRSGAWPSAMVIGSFVVDALGMKRMLGLAFLCHLVGTCRDPGDVPYLGGIGRLALSGPLRRQCSWSAAPMASSRSASIPGGDALPDGEDAQAQHPPCLVAGRADARRTYSRWRSILGAGPARRRRGRGHDDGGDHLGLAGQDGINPGPDVDLWGLVPVRAVPGDRASRVRGLDQRDVKRRCGRCSCSGHSA